LPPAPVTGSPGRETGGVLRVGRARLRPCAKRPLVFLGTLIALSALLGIRSPAHALCNIIPPAERLYPSTLGSVTDPIVAPGDEVTISLQTCDEDGPGFATTAAANVVTVTFLPAGDPQAVVSVAGATVEDCGVGGPCLTLRFTMPSTSSATFPDGLAGPAEIRVLNGGATAALIGPLFQPRPDTTCDKQAETIFRQLTVLPPPNVFQTLIDQPSTRVLAALDGSGSLLIPFDYRDVLPLGPAEPVAALLSGSTTIDAFQNVPGVPIDVPDSRWVRSFTIDGRPVPPLLRATDVGNQVFGASDGAEGIVRVARSLDGAPPIFDLQYLRASNGRGPVVITGGRYSVAPGVAVPLANLRSTTATASFARDESIEGNLNGAPFSPDTDTNDDVVQVIDVATFTSTLTGRAASPIVNPITGGVVDASDDFVAFLESEAQQGGVDLNGDGKPATDDLLRVMTATGDLVTSDVPSAALVGSPFPGVDRKPVAIDGDLVYFREPDVGFQAESGAFEQGVGVDVSPDGRLIATTQPTAGAGCGEVRARRRDGATGSIVTTGFPGVRTICGTTNGVDELTFSPSGNFLYAAAPTAGRLGAFKVALSPDTIGIGGPSAEASLAVPGARRLAVTPFTPDGTVLAQRASLYVTSELEDSVTAIDVSESSFAVGPTLVLARVLQNSAGCVPSATRVCITNFVNPRGVATSPDGKNVYVAVHGSNRVAVFTRQNNSAAIDRVQELIDNGTGGTLLAGPQDVAVSPDGRFVYALADVEDGITIFSRALGTGFLTFVGTFAQGIDADGIGGGRGIEVSPDGIGLYFVNSAAQVVALDRNTATGLLSFNRRKGGGFSGLGSVGLAISPDSEHVYVQSGNQSSGRLFARESRLRAFDTTTGQTRPGLDATVGAKLASVAHGRAAFIQPNEAFGTLFPTVSLYEAASDALVGIDSGAAFANKLAISSQILALAAPESFAGNADGDSIVNEDTLVVASLANPTAPPTVVGADAFELGATDVCAGGANAGDVCESGADCTGGSCQGVAVSLKMRLLGIDGGADLSVAVHRQGTPGFVEIGSNVVDFEVSGNLIAFRDSENGLFRSTCNDPDEIAFDNDDSDCTDLVMRVYDLVTNQVFDTRQATIKCEQPGCEPGLPYKILCQTVNGRRTCDAVAFLTREGDQGEDLDGDGVQNDTVVQIYRIVRAEGEATLQIVKTRDGQFRLPPLVDSFLGQPIVYRDAFEGDLARDVNEDGDQSDVVVLVDGDSDGDGVFDSSDLCVEKPDPAQRDGDGDGLGDACDPTPRCGAVAPAAPAVAPAAANACQDILGKATQTLFRSWAKVRQSCLDRIASGRLAGPAAATCGTVGTNGEPTAPADLTTFAKLFAAFETLQKSIDQKCTPSLLGQLDACATTSAGLVNCLSDRVGAAVVRTTDIAYGDVQQISDAKQRSCQKAIAKQAVNHVMSAGNALRRCVDRVNDGNLAGNAAALCLGAESPLSTTLPTDPTTANALVRAGETIVKRLAKPCAGTIPAPLDACGDDAASIASCARCTGYRQALELIRGAYGP